MKQVNIDKELSIISNAVEHYNLDSVYSLFSGGTDSLAATYVASNHSLFKGVIHLDTGIGIPDVQEYVIRVCKSQGWELKIYKAMEYRKKNGELAPQNYDDLVRSYGFPGPVNHKVMYSRLKEYPLQQANRDIKQQFKCPAFVTGIRIAESTRRAKNYASNLSGGGYDKHKSKVWINPIIAWDSDKKNAFLKEVELPINPVYQYLCKSGECLCGAFAQKNDLLILEVHYPSVYERLSKLYEEVKGMFPWKWDEQPPKSFLHQKKLEKQGQLKIDFSPTCYSCQNIQEQDTED